MIVRSAKCAKCTKCTKYTEVRSSQIGPEVPNTSTAQNMRNARNARKWETRRMRNDAQFVYTARNAHPGLNARKAQKVGKLEKPIKLDMLGKPENPEKCKMFLCCRKIQKAAKARIAEKARSARKALKTWTVQKSPDSASCAISVHGSVSNHSSRSVETAGWRTWRVAWTGWTAGTARWSLTVPTVWKEWWIELVLAAQTVCLSGRSCLAIEAIPSTNEWNYTPVRPNLICISKWDSILCLNVGWDRTEFMLDFHFQNI